MTARVLCQKLCPLGGRHPAFMTFWSDPLASLGNAHAIQVGNGTCFKANNLAPTPALFATTRRVTTGDYIGRTMQKDGGHTSESMPVGDTADAGVGEGGSRELSRKRDDDAPARRPRSRDVFSSLAPAGTLSGLWDPFTTTSRSLRQMLETMGRLFEDTVGPPSRGLDRVFTNVTRMPWDVIETDDAYLLRVDMPGVSKEELRIRVEDNELVIGGEHKDVENENELRSYAAYNMRVVLPKDVKLDEIKADLKNGVLNVVVPKVVKEEQKDVREIQVS